MRRLLYIIVTLAGTQLFLIAAIALPFLRNGFSARTPPTATEARLARVARRLAVPSMLRDAPNPVAPTERTLADARAHFADHCASCHGNDGRGQTTIGRNLYPRVPDMTANSTQAMSDGELFYSIKHGVRFTGMPAWGDDNPADDLATWTLVLFIRHLPDLTPRELEVMATLNPKSPAAWRAEDEQRRFLDGEDLDPVGPVETK